MKHISFIISLFFSYSTFAQVGVGTTTPQATLDITATNSTSPANNDGILIPRMSNFPSSPGITRDGMLIFYTGTGASGKGFYYWNGVTSLWNLMSGVSDADWYKYGTTSTANSINDNIYTLGKTVIADNPPSTINSKLTVLDSDNSLGSGLNVTRVHTNNTAFGHNGIVQTSLLGGSGTFTSVYSALQSLNPSTTTTGTIYNYSAVNNISRGNGFGSNTLYHGVFNSNTGTSISAKSYGVNIDYSSNATSAGDKYGFFIDIDASIPATHYGVFADVRKATGYAGYFLGRTSFGTGTTNRFLMPEVDGAAGQVMTTDGSGNITFQTISGDGIGTDDQTIDNFTLAGTTLNLSLENDGVANQTVDLSSLVSTDADWYEVGSTNTPDDINDNKYSLGNITLGANVASSSKLEVFADNTSTVRFNNSSIVVGDKFGIKNSVNSLNGNNTETTGIENNLFGSGTIKYGVVNNYNYNSDTSISYEFGFRNNFSSSNNVRRTGFYNFCEPLSANTELFMGYENNISANQVGAIRGYSNSITSNSNNGIIGFRNVIQGSNNAAINGVFNSISTTGNPVIYGTQSIITNSGIGRKYGNYVSITNSSGGTHYGIYSDVLQPSGYAGYFLGRVSIGTTASNSYILPPIRGLDGQVMSTDGAGVSNWVDPSSVFTDTQNTLDQAYDKGGAGAGRIINADNGAVEINQNNSNNTGLIVSYNSGAASRNVHIGNTTATEANISINNNTPDGNGLDINMTDSYNLKSKSALHAYNVLGAMDIDIARFEYNGPFMESRYGLKSVFPNGSNSKNYGVFSEAIGANSFAGYFLGDVAIGTIIGNTYTMPPSRGLPYQVMQINGSGDVSWVDSATTFTIGANNGTNYDGTHIQLGGALTEITTITQGANDMIFNLNSTGDFRINDNGTSKLVVLDNGDTVLGGDLYMRDEDTGGTLLGRFIDLNGDDGALELYNSGVISSRINGGGDSYLIGGRLGIGTVTPDYNLSVSGTLNLREDITGGGTALRVNGTEALWFDGTLFSWGFGGTANFFSDDVGIGINVPDYKLDVRDAVANGYVTQISNTSTDPNSDGLKIRVGNVTAPTSSTTYIGFFNGNGGIGTNRGRIQGDGVGVTYNTTSDRRLKTNINDLNNALNLIDKIQPRRYEYKSRLGIQEYGFIAQELQPIYPQAVTGSPDSDEATDPMMVDYSRLTPLLTAGIKELKDEVDQLKAENDILKAQLLKYVSFEARLFALENNKSKTEKVALTTKN